MFNACFLVIREEQCSMDGVRDDYSLLDSRVDFIDLSPF